MMSKIKPNLGMPTRIAFVVIGMGLVGAPLVRGMEGGAAIALPLLGIATMLAGLSGL